MLLLMSTLLWQCEKDIFEGETVGVCPIVTSTDPANGATNVVTNKLITATFNEAMLPASINGETYTIKEGSVLIPGVVTYADKIATFTPTKPLEANKTYTGTVTKKVKDPDGNFPIENYTWSFTTGNVPTVIATDPVSAASSVPLNKIITATFSTAMDPATINTATFLINQGTTPIVGTVTYTGTTATFTPTSPLVDNKVYTGTITIGAKDVVGNALATHYKWSFSTAQTQFTINLSSNPAEGGSTSGGGLFNKDDQATVVAVPATGYTFTNWTEGTTIVSTNASYALTVTSNRTLVANFGINTYSLTVTATNGSVTKVPNQTTFNYGTSVLITAIPNTGYSFTGWSGDAIGTSNSVTVLMISNKNITANFALTPPDTYTLNVTATLGGTAVKNPNQTGYTSGTSVQVTATPIAGYTFSGWTGDATGTTNPLSVNMNSNKNIVANFALIPVVTYSLNVTSNNGVVVKNPNQANYAQGSTVQLSATPNTGYTFTGWSGDATGTTNPLTVTMNSDKNITAIFTLTPPSTYTLNVTAVNGTVLKNPNQTNYTAGTNVQLTPTPNTGYVFSGWSGDATGTEDPLLVQMNSNKNITANFTLIPVNTYTLNVIALNGTVLKNPNTPTYSSGATVQLTATPNTGYTFTGWSGDATGTNNPLTVNMNSNKNITANFTLIPVNTYTLNVTAVNGTVVKNPNTATYNSGSTVQLTATPSVGYTFTSWSGDATGSTNPLTVTMNANKNITANFTAIPPTTYTLNVIAVNGTVLKNPNTPTYNSGATVQLTATPSVGYTFTSWSGDATGSINPLTVTMNSNKNVTANFAAVIIPPLGPGAVNLGTAANFVALGKTGIGAISSPSITGDIGVSPGAATSITGFSLIMDGTGTFSTSSLVNGKIYAADYTAPTPAKMTTAIGDMESALTEAMGMVTAPIVDLGAGNISGMTLVAGLYKYNTGLLITNQGVTLTGGPNDTWVFQIASDFTVNPNAIITLSGGAQAKNVFWVTSTQALIDTNVQFKGNILAQTLISINSGSNVVGRLLSQTAVTLNGATVVKP
jgi:uncharacterized repeat protein (TIGR02543 family)